MQVNQRVALTGHAFVKFNQCLGDIGSRCPQTYQRVDNILDRMQILKAQRVSDPQVGEELPTPGLGPQGKEAGVSGVHWDPQRDGEVPLEWSGVVRHQVRPQGVRHE